MKSCIMFFRQFYGHFRGLQTSGGTANFRVHLDGHVFAELFAVSRFVGADGRFVFAMGRNENRHLRKERFQGFGFVHQHIAGTGPHKNLDPADCAGVGF